MGLRFRKSVKVLPGVRLNISKTGVSTSLGVKGASVNLSKRGVYQTTGIPGTGLSSRQRLDAPQTNDGRAQVTFWSWVVGFGVVLILLIVVGLIARG